MFNADNAVNAVNAEDDGAPPFVDGVVGDPGAVGVKKSRPVGC